MNNLLPVTIDKNIIRSVFERRDISDNTIDEYTRLLQSFLIFMTGRKVEDSTLLDYKRHLANRIDISVAYKSKKLTAAIIFLQEIYGKEKFSVKNFKQTTGHKKEGITAQEAQDIFLYIYKKDSRTKAIISLMYYQGLREIEIHRLDVEDINLTDGTMMIKGKGRDDKEMVYLHPECAKALKEFIPDEGILFKSESTNGTNGGRLSTRSIRKIVSDLLKECGINKTPHGFRHLYVTKVLDILEGLLSQYLKGLSKLPRLFFCSDPFKLI